jgi:Questin oxidase-like
MADTIDAALDILHQTGPEYSGGTNHGPMAAEALLAMGRPEAILPWVEDYKRRLTDHPTPSTPIARAEWREALGDGKRLADWIAFFDRELTDTPWPDVVHRWVPAFVPGLMAAAAHGLLRTSHAVRCLARAETPPRLHELAEGLGYWAARYRELPGRPSEQDAGWSPREALVHVHRLHGPGFQVSGSISGAITGLDAEPSFPPTIDLVSARGDLARFLSELTAVFAGVYLTHTDGLIAFVHAVTAPSALRLLLPYLAEADARLAARYAWQACAALYAWYATASGPSFTTLEQITESHDALIDRAIAAGGAHSIKFTEACLREYAIDPKAVYLVAARDVAERVGAR